MIFTFWITLKNLWAFVCTVERTQIIFWLQQQVIGQTLLNEM